MFEQTTDAFVFLYDNSSLIYDDILYDWNLLVFNQSQNVGLENSTNITDDQSGLGDTRGAGYPTSQAVPLGLTLSCLCLLTIVGNAMVLHAVRTEKRLQSVSNMFIVSLALADLVVGLVVMPISALYIFTDVWYFGVAVCQIWVGTDYIASTASILNLFILSLDRYWSVTSPLKYMRKRTKRRAFIMIFLVWLISFLWMIPITGWHFFVHGGIRTVPSDVCDTEYATNVSFKIVTAFFNFYLPLAVMYALYFRIFQAIRRRSEFELGQRIEGGCSSYNSAAVTYNSALDDSEAKNSTGGDDTTPPSTAYGEHTQVYVAVKQKPSQYKNRNQDKKCAYKPVPFSNSVKLVSGGCSYRCVSAKAGSEYVYDESVVDPQTEKLERFYYEEPIGFCRAVDGGCGAELGKLYRETSLSTPSLTSSSSVEKDKRHKVCPINNVHRFSLNNSVKQKHSNTDDMHCLKKFEITSLGCSRRGKTLDRETDLTRRKDPSVQHHAQWQSGNNELQVANTLKKPLHTTDVGVTNPRSRLKRIKHGSQLSREIKAARQLGVIMGAFTLCFLPYFILFMVVAFCEECVDPGLLTAMTWIGYLNSTLNPFLYPLCNEQFRRKFQRMLHLDTAYRRRLGHIESRTYAASRYD